MDAAAPILEVDGLNVRFSTPEGTRYEGAFLKRLGRLEELTDLRATPVGWKAVYPSPCLPFTPCGFAVLAALVPLPPAIGVTGGASLADRIPRSNQ
jgi:hypothetical protein